LKAQNDKAEGTGTMGKLKVKLSSMVYVEIAEPFWWSMDYFPRFIET
jgi:hypothetical protein